jgi:hypothetical protein
MSLAKLGKPSWCKGLTSRDPRIAQLVDNLVKHNKGRPPWNKGKPSPKVWVNLSPSADLSYLLGVLAGDGWISANGGTYRVGLHCLSKDFAFKFYNTLGRLGFHPQKSQYFNYGYGQKLMYRVKAESRVFVDWYHTLSPDQIRDIVKDYSNDYLRGFFDSEGSFGNRSLYLSNTNLSLCKLVQSIAHITGFNFHLHQYPYSQGRPGIEYRLDLHGGKSEIERFRHEVLKESKLSRGGH